VIGIQLERYAENRNAEADIPKTVIVMETRDFKKVIAQNLLQTLII
jgi:hypothetical protein